MTARSRARANDYRRRVDDIARAASLEFAPSAARSAVAPYALHQGKAWDLIARAAYRAAYSAAYQEAATSLLKLPDRDHLPDGSTWSTVAVDAAAAAASRAYAVAVFRQNAQRSSAAWLLRSLAHLLPADVRGRWLQEWAGEVATIEGRRAKVRYAWQTLRGLPGLAWTLWTSAAEAQR
jgi:hypothetical protein